MFVFALSPLHIQASTPGASEGVLAAFLVILVHLVEQVTSRASVVGYFRRAARLAMTRATP
jgi:hypothetical protein